MRSGTIAFLLGICGLTLTPALPAPGICLLLVPMAAAAALGERSRLVGWLLAGVLWAAFHGHLAMRGSLPDVLEGRDLSVVGSVVSIPEEHALSRRFLFSIEGVEGGQGWGGRVRLAWYRPSVRVEPGQRWRLTVRLKRPSGFMNPGTFDYERWLFQRRIVATGYVREPRSARRLETAGRFSVTRVRGAIAAAIDDILREHDQRGTVAALAVGHREAISRRQWEVLRETGTGHLMAISGLHVGLVAGAAFLVLRWLWSRSVHGCRLLPAPRAGAAGAILAAVSYAALADFAIPTQRALVMLALIMGNLAAGRRSAPSSVLALALFGVLLLDPFSVLSPGFWLSFAAVAVILVSLCGRAGSRRGWTSWWWRWGRLPLTVALGLVPLTFAFFSHIPLTAPLANAIAVPWVGCIVVPLTLGGVAMLPLAGELAALLLTMSAAGMDMLWKLLETLADLDLAVRTLPAPGPWEIALMLILTGLGLLPAGTPGRWLALFTLPLLFFRPPAAPVPGGLELTVLDVGQGLSVVARTARHVLVYDAGPRYPGGLDTGEAVTGRYLQSVGVSTVDVLIVSHRDNDHAGGAAGLSDLLEVTRVVSNADLSFVITSACRAGEEWRWDGVRFEILWPEETNRSDSNNGSCVLRVSAGSASILLPGDIETESESGLLRRYPPSRLRTDILVAPHHGSRTSSGEAFLDTVRPRHVVFSVGYRNRFGFPNPLVLERYRRRGVSRYDTVRDGAVTYSLLPGGELDPPKRHRVEARRFWHR